MDFRTVIKPIKTDIRIDHRNQVFLTGSCFTENIGRKMSSGLFNVCINVTGTIYNPLSISSSLRRSMSLELYRAESLVSHDGLFHSMDHHSSFSSVNANDVIEHANEALYRSHEALKNASALIVTFGTSRAYRYLPTQEIACNCHKLPSKMFETVCLSVDDIVNDWQNLINTLQSFNKRFKIIFTISPIRYKSYGFHESNVDKATLLIAVDRLVSRFSDRSVYFPSYEIMYDDLRDYRFYASDMIHPSEAAVDYIYDIFANSFYDASTLRFEKQCRKLTTRLQHRFLTDNHSVIEEFKNENISLAQELIADCPEIAKTLENYIK